jgi:hypothetical protein
MSVLQGEEEVTKPKSRGETKQGSEGPKDAGFPSKKAGKRSGKGRTVNPPKKKPS